MKCKSKMFSMRFSENDYERIKHNAQKADMDMTGYITTSALNKQIVVVDGLDRMIAELKGIGRNLNQLTTLCNMGKIQCLDLADVKQSFGIIFDKLCDLCDRSY